MIRLIYVLRKLPGMSLQEFQGYWRENHGPLVARHAASLSIDRYIQLHTMESPAHEAMRELRGLMEPYDGVAELWFDNQDELRAEADTAKQREAGLELLEDERKFIDFSKSSMWVATDVPQINPTPENIMATEDSSIVKLFYVFRRPPNLSRAETHLYWRMNHGPLIRRNVPPVGILRYIQVHTIDHPMADQSREMRGGMEEIYDGHAELWYDMNRPVGDVEASQKAVDLFLEDERNFIDFSRSAMWYGKEHVFVER
ncbi:MAG: EthD domain-containing protein [Deltaproteobacteria bacterium]|nr:EthD domain-containing protein [Deltaproteobacteria bacterium]